MIAQQGQLIRDPAVLIGRLHQFWNGSGWAERPCHEIDLPVATNMAEHILERVVFLEDQ